LVARMMVLWAWDRQTERLQTDRQTYVDSIIGAIHEHASRCKKLNGSVNITRIILHENQSYQSGKTPIAQRKRKRERER